MGGVKRVVGTEEGEVDRYGPASNPFKPGTVDRYAEVEVF